MKIVQSQNIKKINLVNKKILILGGCGFIGSHLAEALCENNEIICYDKFLFGNKIKKKHPNLKIIKKDIVDYNSLLKYSKNIDVIYHLASIVGVDVVAKNHIKSMEEEMKCIVNVFRVMKANNVKNLVFASTSAVYGNFNYKKKVKENDPTSPTSSYSIAKLHSEFYIKYNSKKYNINCKIVRPFNIYGKRQDSRMVIPRMINQAKKNKNITIYFDGKQTRDFTYIDDFVNCLILLYKPKAFKIYNFSRGVDANILTLANIIKKKLNSKSKLSFHKPNKKIIEFQVHKRRGNSELFFKDLKYKPKTSLSEGLDKILKIK
jgi:UDP-glucose 4-epimerase